MRVGASRIALSDVRFLAACPYHRFGCSFLPGPMNEDRASGCLGSHFLRPGRVQPSASVRLADLLAPVENQDDESPHDAKTGCTPPPRPRLSLRCPPGPRVCRGLTARSEPKERGAFRFRPAAVAPSTLLLVLLAAAADSVGAQTRPAQSLNPDISVIVDFLADLSPAEPRVTENGQRFSVREVELGLQAAVDPFFRGDAFLALHGGEIEIEEAYLTALALPGELQARIGRFALPMGRVNLTHRPELLTLEYPLVIRTYFGEEGYSGTGLAASRIFAPLGFFQSIEIFLLNGVEGDSHDHGTGHGDVPHDGHDHGEETAGDLRIGGEGRRGLEQVGALVHLKNYVDLSTATNLEVGMSWAGGTVERYRRLGPGDLAAAGPPADVFRIFPAQHVFGINTVVRWRPPERGLYRSFIWSTEAIFLDGPESRVWGGFTQIQLQVGRRTYVGGRLDSVRSPGFHEVEVFGEGAERHLHWLRSVGGEGLHAGSGSVTFFPSEFSRFRIGVEREWGAGFGPGSGRWRAAWQATFSMGPHRPHPF